MRGKRGRNKQQQKPVPRGLIQDEHEVDLAIATLKQNLALRKYAREQGIEPAGGNQP